MTELHKKIEKQTTQIFDNTNELKEKQIKDESHLQELSDVVDFITKKSDKYKQEKKERQEIINNLTKQENTDELCIKMINERLDLDVNDRDIDGTHRIRNPRNPDEKPRPVITKLVRSNDRKKIFDIKENLKGKEYCNHRKFDGYTYEKVEWGKGKV